MTVDDGFTLYLNGAVVGTAPNTTDEWKSAQVFTVALSPTVNLFAVLAFNRADVNTGGEGPAGLLASIQISFSDGTSAIIVSDSTWKATKTIPPQFQSLATDDSQWESASILGAYGSGPWGTQVTLPSSGPALSLNGSTWIWSSESDTKPNAPAGSRAFRNTYTVPSGKEAVGITAIVTADNSFVLYLNGGIVGTSPTGINAWQTAERYTLSVLPSSNVAPTQFLFAVNATNDPDATTGDDGPAGLLAAIQISYSDGTFDIYRSDSTWLVDKTVASNFFQVSTSDSTWSNATTIGLYGIQPWSNVVISAASASTPAVSTPSTSTPSASSVSHSSPSAFPATTPLFTPTSVLSNSPDTITTANPVSSPATTTSSNAVMHSSKRSTAAVLSALVLGAFIFT